MYLFIRVLKSHPKTVDIFTYKQNVCVCGGGGVGKVKICTLKLVVGGGGGGGQR